MKKIYLLPLNFLAVLLVFSITVLAQESTQSVIARASDMNKKAADEEKTEAVNPTKSGPVDGIKVQANWIQLLQLPKTDAKENILRSTLRNVSFLTGNPAADPCGLKVNGLKKGDDKVAGTADKDSKITIEVIDSENESIPTEEVTVGENKQFSISLKDKVDSSNKVILSITCGTPPVTKKVFIPVTAVELKPNVVEQVNIGAIKITGKTTPKASVGFFRKKATKAEVTTAADTNGNFILRLDTPITVEDKPYLEFTVEDQTTSVEIEPVGFLDETHANIIGIAPFGVVTSQQASKFSKADPAGGFIVGYRAASKQQRLCRINIAEPDKAVCYHRVYDSKRFRKLQDNSVDDTIYKEYQLFKQTNEPVPANDGKKYTWTDNEFDFRRNLNIRFHGIFESDGRKASVPNEDTVADPMTMKKTDIPFIASTKTFDAGMEIWTEYEFDHSPVLRWGPYAALGGTFALNRSRFLGDEVSVDTDNTAVPEGEIKTSEAVIDNDGKMYLEGGLIFNLYNGGNRTDTNLYVQAIAAFGYYQAYADLRPEANTKRRGIAKLRVFPFGLNRDFFARGVATPMFGVDLNAGKGPDHAKFFVGVAFNITKFISKYKGEE